MGIDPDDLNSETSYQPSTLYAKTKLLNILTTRSAVVVEASPGLLHGGSSPSFRKFDASIGLVHKLRGVRSVGFSGHSNRCTVSWGVKEHPGHLFSIVGSILQLKD